MTQAEKRAVLTLDLWPEYLEFVATENRKIRRRNDKAWAESKEYSDSYTKRVEKENVEIERRNEENRRRFEEKTRAWDAQPLHKRMLGDERPWIGPHRIPTRSAIGWVFPMLEPEKEPSIEEFLTWQTKRKLRN